MNDIEKRARELVMAEIPNLTNENSGYQRITVINLHVVMRLFRDALTPPESYVLVPVEPTAEMLQAAAFGVAAKSGQKFKPMMSAGYAAMLAARPAVSP